MSLRAVVARHNSPPLDPIPTRVQGERKNSSRFPRASNLYVRPGKSPTHSNDYETPRKSPAEDQCPSPLSPQKGRRQKTLEEIIESHRRKATPPSKTNAQALVKAESYESVLNFITNNDFFEEVTILGLANLPNDQKPKHSKGMSRFDTVQVKFNGTMDVKIKFDCSGYIKNGPKKVGFDNTNQSVYKAAILQLQTNANNGLRIDENSNQHDVLTFVSAQLPMCLISQGDYMIECFRWEVSNPTFVKITGESICDDREIPIYFRGIRYNKKQDFENAVIEQYNELIANDRDEIAALRQQIANLEGQLAAKTKELNDSFFKRNRNLDEQWNRLIVGVVQKNSRNLRRRVLTQMRLHYHLQRINIQHWQRFGQMILKQADIRFVRQCMKKHQMQLNVYSRMERFVSHLLQNHKRNVRTEVLAEWKAVQHQQKINELRWESLVRGAVSAAKTKLSSIMREQMYAENLATQAAKRAVELEAELKTLRTELAANQKVHEEEIEAAQTVATAAQESQIKALTAALAAARDAQETLRTDQAAEIEALKTEHETATAQLAAKKQTLEEQIERLRTEHAEATAALEEAQRNLVELGEQRAAKEKDHAAATTALEEAQRNREGKEQELAEAEKRASVLEAEIEEAQTVANETQEALAQNVTKIKSLQDNLATAQSEYEAQIAGKEQELTATRAAKTAAEKRASELEAEIQRLNAAHEEKTAEHEAAQTATTDQLEAELKTLRTEHAAASERFTMATAELEAAQTTTSDQLATKEKELERLKTEHAEATVALAAARDAQETLRTELATATTQIKVLGEQRAAKEKELTATLLAKTAAETRASELEAEIQRLNAAHEEKTAELAAAQTTTSDQLAAAENRASELESELITLRKQLQTKEIAHNEVLLAKTAAETRASELEAEIQRLNAAHEEKTAEIQRLNAAHEEKQRKSKGLTQHTKKKQRSTKRLKQRLQINSKLNSKRLELNTQRLQNDLRWLQRSSQRLKQRLQINSQPQKIVLQSLNLNLSPLENNSRPRKLLITRYS